MPAPICVRCEIEMRTKTNGVPVLETYGEEKKPYKLWNGDLWQCTKCLNMVIVGFAKEPMANHFDEGFEKTLEQERIRSGKVFNSHERRFAL